MDKQPGLASGNHSILNMYVRRIVRTSTYVQHLYFPIARCTNMATGLAICQYYQYVKQCYACFCTIRHVLSLLNAHTFYNLSLVFSLLFYSHTLLGLHNTPTAKLEIYPNIFLSIYRCRTKADFNGIVYSYTLTIYHTT